MALRGTFVGLVMATSALSVACGTKTTDPGKQQGAGTCEPTGDIPCYVGKAEPCQNFHTEWAGDELCLAVPDHGNQIHIGPSDYTDPAEVAKYVLPPGGIPADDPRAKIVGSGTPDVDWCYNMKTPNDQTEWTNQYYSHMRPGSHHQIIFGLNGDIPDSTGMDNCSSRDSGVLGGASFLAGATRSVQDAAMFGGAPEDARIAGEVPPHQQLAVNLHFVNIGDKPLLQEIWVNMIGIDFPAEEIQKKVKAIEWYGGVGMAIKPNEHTVIQGAADGSCQAAGDMRILGVTGHVHASTLRYAMYMQRAGETTKTQVFEDYNWTEPTVFRFNTATQNNAPDPTAKIPGANINGVYNVSKGDTFSWECEVENKRNVTLTFSDKAYDGEMCNVFGMYAADNPTDPWLCFSF
jgi:hypothetical protein